MIRFPAPTIEEVADMKRRNDLEDLLLHQHPIYASFIDVAFSFDIGNRIPDTTKESDESETDKTDGNQPNPLEKT